MITRIYPTLERHIEGVDSTPAAGSALARVVELHPALTPLLDFYAPDPLQMAREIGMVYQYEEDTENDLDEIDFGPMEWFEPSAGLTAVQNAIDLLREDPASIARAIYDPSLKTDDVIADLLSIIRILELAQQHEVRFHFNMDGESGLWPRPST